MDMATSDHPPDQAQPDQPPPAHGKKPSVRRDDWHAFLTWLVEARETSGEDLLQVVKRPSKHAELYGEFREATKSDQVAPVKDKSAKPHPRGRRQRRRKLSKSRASGAKAAPAPQPVPVPVPVPEGEQPSGRVMARRGQARPVPMPAPATADAEYVMADRNFTASPIFNTVGDQFFCQAHTPPFAEMLNTELVSILIQRVIGCNPEREAARGNTGFPVSYPACDQCQAPLITECADS